MVHYHKCFQEGGHLYIVMELIEGAPLSDIITSLADKKERFEENRIWRIFTQVANLVIVPDKSGREFI